jgi:hypothetical protein
VLLIVPLEETKRWNEEGSCADRSNEDITMKCILILQNLSYYKENYTYGYSNYNRIEYCLNPFLFYFYMYDLRLSKAIHFILSIVNNFFYHFSDHMHLLPKKCQSFFVFKGICEPK